MKSDVSIVGYVDNDSAKWSTSLDGIRIYPPKEILTLEYDRIILSPLYYEKVLEECRDLNVAQPKIVVFMLLQESDDYIDIRGKEIYELEKKCELLESRLENKPYELGIGVFPQVKSAEELLQRIYSENCSLSRFGDGEFEMIRGAERPWFQNCNENLSRKLNEILHSDSRKCLIAIADNFGSLDNYTQFAADAIRLYLKGKREELVKLLGKEPIYYDAYVTRPFMMRQDKSYAATIFDLWKMIWENRNVLIVEGKYSGFGLENDLIDNAQSIRRIVAPHKNAYDKYDDILQSVLKHAKKDDLILITLGPTATVLAYDLANNDYQALDVGQIDNEYEWYLHDAKERTEIHGKLVAESGLKACDEIEDPLYLSQVIDRVL